MQRTRRQFIASGAAIGTASWIPDWVPILGGGDDDVVYGINEGKSLEEREDEFDVEIDFPHDWLDRWKPLLIMDYQTSQRSHGLFGYRVRSERYDSDYAYYWHRLSHQDGADLPGGIRIEEDAHLWDHEPFIAEIQDGSIVSGTYTMWHHFADTISGEDLVSVLEERVASEPTHTPLRVIDPWHHYAVESEPDPSDTVALDVQSNSSGDEEGPPQFLPTWERRNVFTSASAEAIYDPEAVPERGSWWAEGTRDYRWASRYNRLGQYINIGGSGETIQEDPNEP